MSDADRAFHDSLKPSWGPDGTLVYASSDIKPMSKSRRAREKDGLLTIQKGGIVSESRDIRFAKFSNESSPDALKKHQALTVIQNLEGVPFATLPDSYSFLDFFDNQNARDPSVAHEKLVWELASILFDPLNIPAELEHIENALERLRKDKLSAFWQKLVDQAAAQQAAMARSNEEKAIAALSGHNIPEACGHLVNGKNFHLATLVAMIGGKESLKKDIREQLAQWQKSKVLAEFSQPIRALYELLAGNVCICDGAKGSPEDRIESFIISKRFGLDWRQAFGMRLWYAIKTTDDIDDAVKSFSEDMVQDKETSRPQAWYVEQRIPKLWKDNQVEHREDLLWGLLKLYAYEDADIEAIIRPENSQLSPLDMRLSWQLSRALTSFSSMDYREASDEKKDQTTLAFAAQLNGEGHWLDAIFVLLHLSDKNARAKSIQDHLARHAGRIGSEDSQSFTTLVQNFKIPTSWIWEAKALYMRSVKKEPLGEVECLIKAGLFDEAHRTFAREVAPKTIIEYDYSTLRSLLANFEGKENAISDWHLGGEIYRDYLFLLESQKKSQEFDLRVLERLLAGLPAAVEDARHPAFMETVAIETMSGVVAKTVVELAKKGEVRTPTWPHFLD
jgi:nuclear pore complex protein Nup98-Nup96